MEYEEINPGVWKYEKEDDSVEGIYVSKKEKVGVNDSNAYYLQNTAGKQVMIWGSTIIDDRMQFVNRGDYIKITFKGKTENSKHQTVNLFKIERATLNGASA